MGLVWSPPAMQREKQAPVGALLTACKGFCDELSSELIEPVYAQVSAIGVERKSDNSHFSLADGVVQVRAARTASRGVAPNR